MTSYRSGVATGVLFTALTVGAAGGGWWLWNAPPLAGAKTVPPPVPAAVPTVAKEDQFAAVTLTADGEARLAMQTGKVERKSARRVRVYGGEVTVPPGRAILVSAPIGGTLVAPTAGVPRPGQPVTAGQPVFRLVPLLTPEGQATLSTARVDAEGAVQNAKATLDATRIALDRANQMLRDGTGSRRLVDEALAPFEVAKKTGEAAVARRDLLARVLGEAGKGTSEPLPIDSPEAGVVRAVSAMPGQTVPPGAALFEVVDVSRVWVRVPVYVGDRADLDTGAPAAVGDLTARPGGPSREATPVPAPPSANAAAGTVDLFYELDNAAAKYSPGERVGVTLPLRGEADSLTVPWAAVVYDINGGTWVYERVADRAYTRRRVVVRYVAGGDAVLAAGPPVGTVVVTAGAAELFGTETGFSK